MSTEPLVPVSLWFWAWVAVCLVIFVATGFFAGQQHPDAFGRAKVACPLIGGKAATVDAEPMCIVRGRVVRVPR